MKRLLLNADPAEGNGNPDSTKPADATPPKAAEAVANGKSEREKLLERQNAALRTAAQRAKDSRRTAEERAAYAQREAEKLKEQQSAVKSKFTWMGYGG